MFIRFILCSFLAVGFYGCSHSVLKPVIIGPHEGISALVLEEEHVPTYIKREGNHDRICLSPDSDAVPTTESAFSVGAKAIGHTDNVGIQSGTGELSLGGRSPTVLIAREFLYRACELTTNLNTDNEKTIETYKMFLESLERISSSATNLTGSNPLAASAISDTSEKQDDDESDGTASSSDP